MRGWSQTALTVLAGWVASAGPPPHASPVYPARSEHLRFSHQEHHPIACAECHPGMDQRRRPAPCKAPGHERCAACHQEASNAVTYGPACRRCHLGAPRSQTRRAASLKFSHALHLANGGSCTECHDPRAARPVASFESCEGCHRSLLEADRCDTCHPARADGRLKLDAVGGRLAPTGGHGGDDHRPGWESGHGRVAGQRAERCRVCHTGDSCDRCHRGVMRPMRQHPADWEMLHATAARGDAHRCDVCHRTQSDCIGCHRRTGLAVTARKRPLGLRVHPENFGSSGLHGSEARRNLKRCTACHAEGDCIRCHGGAGLGLGVSPHPPAFRSRCRLMRKRNPRPCAKCHLPGDLERLCP